MTRIPICASTFLKTYETLLSHNCSWCQVDEQVYIIDQLDAMGTRLDEMYAPGAAGYLYDLR